MLILSIALRFAMPALGCFPHSHCRE